MLHYYLALGLRSLRRNPALTVLILLTLAVGVAASISTLTILHMMSGDPIPSKSQRLLTPLFEVGALRSYDPNAPREEYEVVVTYKDSVAMLNSGVGVRRTPVLDVAGAVEPERPGLPVADIQGIAATRDFFGMFDVPFLRGGPWSEAEDRSAARVVVLSKRKAEALFGGADGAMGRKLRIWDRELTVVGVTGHWAPVPRYMHVLNGSGGLFNGIDDMFVPFHTAIAAEQRSNGTTNCSDSPEPGYENFLKSECTWMFFWFETADASGRKDVRQWLDAYQAEQRRLGRLQRPVPVKLFDVMEWLDYVGVVENDNRIAVWLSLGFLAICMVNTMGLLLAKFSVRSGEVGVRRALGASRAEIFRQFLVESAVVGGAGGLLGLGLSLASLWLIRKQAPGLENLAHMDWRMFAMTFALAMGASLAAGLLPTWRASRVTPALQLKSQ
jgi:putative ABC transport system permease protein